MPTGADADSAHFVSEKVHGQDGFARSHAEVVPSLVLGAMCPLPLTAAPAWLQAESAAAAPGTGLLLSVSCLPSPLLVEANMGSFGSYRNATAVL